ERSPRFRYSMTFGSPFITASHVGCEAQFRTIQIWLSSRVPDRNPRLFSGNRPGRRTIGGAGLARALNRLVHDAADGARAAPALRAAAEALIDLERRAWRVGASAGLAHLVVGQHVAGTDDHFQLRSLE